MLVPDNIVRSGTVQQEPHGIHQHSGSSSIGGARVTISTFRVLVRGRRSRVHCDCCCRGLCRAGRAIPISIGCLVHVPRMKVVLLRGKRTRRRTSEKGGTGNNSPAGEQSCHNIVTSAELDEAVCILVLVDVVVVGASATAPEQCRRLRRRPCGGCGGSERAEIDGWGRLSSTYYKGGRAARLLWSG